MKKIITLVLILLMLQLKVNINAESSSVTRSLNRFGELVVTQDAYEPLYSLASFKGEQLNNPKDIYIDNEDYIYIADTGNKKIVVLDNNEEFILSFGDDKLIKPTGVFVRDNLIYIADYGSSEDRKSGRVYVYKFDKQLEEITLLNSFERPNSPVLTINDFNYRPSKIAVDANKTMYVVSEGSYNGILMINENNRFLGFFAPNEVKGTIRDYVLQFLYGNSEGTILKKKIPTAPFNVYLKDTGYIYTVTQTGVSERGYGSTVKKVNNGGINFFSKNLYAASDFTSIAMGSVGNVYAVTRSGYIFEYDNEGNLLFIFGGPSGGANRLGLFENAVGIAVNSKGEVIVLDEVQNNLHLFTPTNFASTVHEALDLYNQGKYIESQSSWEEVLKYNALFDRAHEGIGKSYFIQGEYKKALEKFKIAEAKEEYSQAYWEIRNVWLQKYAGVFIIIFAVSYVGILILKRQNWSQKLIKENDFISKVQNNNSVAEIKRMFYYLKHPLDAFYEGKATKKIKTRTGIGFVLIMVVLYVLYLLLSGPLFKPVVLEKTIFLEEILKVLTPFITYVFANYLISSLMEGEGTFRAIFINTIGSLMPIVLILPILIVLSNVLTYNEIFIYQFLMFIMVAWSALLLFFNVKDTHNFTVKETIYHFIMSVLMMIVMLIIVVMVYMMLNQVVTFIADLIKEVIIRG